MDEEKARQIASSYVSSWLSEYERLAKLVAGFLGARLDKPANKVPSVHLIQKRAKDPHSLLVNLKNDRYRDKIGKVAEVENIDDLKRIVHDLAGVRVIFYFRDDLERFAEMKEMLKCWFGKRAHDEFDTKRIELESPRGVVEPFGYSSYHFPVLLNEHNEHTEFFEALQSKDRERLSGLQCEVQVRTLLQHAWAETEHELRYKGLKSKKGDRVWGMLSAILEAADYLLLQQKDAVIEYLVGSEKITMQAWQYLKPSDTRCCYEYEGTFYQYQVLHRWDSTPSLTFREEGGLFDVDMAMKAKGVGDEYKATMWKKLSEDSPAFIASFRFDSTTARVNAWHEGSAVVTVQPARYSDQMVTNHKQVLARTIDVSSNGSHYTCALEDLAYRTSRSNGLLPFDESPFSNTIGIACVLLTRDNWWVIASRSRGVAYEPNRVGCSASGALEWSEPPYRDRTLDEWVKDAMKRECVEELGIDPPSERLVYLAFARELGRAGKPQLFFLLDMRDGVHGNGISFEDVRLRWKMHADSEDSENTQLLKASEDQVRLIIGSDSQGVASAMSELGTPSAIPSEELRMNLALALQFTEAASRTS